MQARRMKSHRLLIAILAHAHRRAPRFRQYSPACIFWQYACTGGANAQHIAAQCRNLHHQPTIMQLDPVRQWCCTGHRRKRSNSRRPRGRCLRPCAHDRDDSTQKEGTERACDCSSGHLLLHKIRQVYRGRHRRAAAVRFKEAKAAEGSQPPRPLPRLEAEH